jgi:flavin-dependent dehydrogenase
VDVTLLDAEDGHAFRPGEYLPSVGRSQLAKLGFPDDVLKLHATSCFEVRSWWGSSEAVRLSLFDPYGEGYVLSRPEFDMALARHVASEGVRVKRPARPLRAQWKDRQWHLLVRLGRSQRELLTCDFIVDASGRRAALARTLGATSVRYDRLIGMTGLVSIPRGHWEGPYLLLEAAPTGWWYSTMLRNQLIVNFMTDGDLVKRDGTQLQFYWTNRLSEAPLTKTRLQGGKLRGELRCRPAHTQSLYPCYGQRWLAIGDAATSFDPLSSQGICKGLEDGQLAAAAVRGNLDGEADALEGFAKDVQRRFLVYLALRHVYYNQEKRWPERAFWRRRSNQAWTQAMLWLEPTEWIEPRRRPNDREVEEMQLVTPSIDFERLDEMIAGGCSAKEAVTRYKSIAPQSPDQEIIVALQLLLEAASPSHHGRTRSLPH